jgi:IS5 family transposase
LFQQKNDKDKIYSLHEPHVECIAKVKANKAYEFGDKVSIDRSRDIGIILGAQPYREVPVMVIPLMCYSSNSNELMVHRLKS